MQQKRMGEGDMTVRDRPKGEVYALVLPHGKVYIGKSAKGARFRWSQHVYQSKHPKQPISYAIAKWGKENVKVIVLARTDDQVALSGLEQFYIDDYGTRDPHFGYNLTDGGDGTVGYVQTDEWRKQQSERKKGWKPPPEHIAHLRRLSAERIGKPLPAETREKVRATLTGTHRPPEVIAKVSKSLTGKKRTPFSEQTLEKMRLAHKGQKPTDEQRAQISKTLTGRTLSPETRAKIGAAHKGRKHSAEHAARSAAAQRGTTRSAEAREHNRQSKLKWYEEHPEARDRLRTQNIGKKLSSEHRAKIAAGHKGRKCSAEASEHMRLAWNNRKVRKEGTSQETREKIRQTLLARYEQHPEMKEHLRQKALGKPKSPEAIEKQRQALIATLQKKRQSLPQGDPPCPATK